ncbi:hypothetical protein ACFQ22_10725 [Lentilactobacillus raoultii]|uniref:Uncharacterized protein n=1 Tax=Lentilactobacillus raoultii TaxID=1987503 RepID=A0ABW3PQC3_9LACO|nr:hypothetical protein [Lentilactobacillus raoultii]
MKRLLAQLINDMEIVALILVVIGVIKGIVDFWRFGQLFWMSYLKDFIGSLFWAAISFLIVEII